MKQTTLGIEPGPANSYAQNPSLFVVGSSRKAFGSGVLGHGRVRFGAMGVMVPTITTGEPNIFTLPD